MCLHRDPLFIANLLEVLGRGGRGEEDQGGRHGLALRGGERGGGHRREHPERPGQRQPLLCFERVGHARALKQQSNRGRLTHVQIQERLESESTGRRASRST